MKNLRKIGFLSAILLVLLVALIVVLVSRCVDRKRLREEEENNTFTLCATENVRMLSIKESSGEETVFRFGSTSGVESASHDGKDFISGQLESSEIFDLLYHVTTVSLGNQFDVSSSELGSYGLSPAQYTVTVALSDGTQKTLLVGNLNSNRNSVYICEAGQTHVMMAEYSMYKRVSSDFETYISRMVLNLNRTDVDKIDFYRKSNGDAWTLVFLEDYDNGYFLEQRYKVTYPMEREPNSELISLGNTILNLNVAQYIPISQEDYASYGLDDPEYTFTIRMKNGEEVKLYLSAEFGGYYYGHSSNNPYTFCVNPGVLPGLNRSPFDMIDSYVIHGYLNDVRSVNVTMKEKTFTIEIMMGTDFALDDTVFTLDKRNAKVYTSEGDCYGLLLFGSIFNMPVSRVDYDVKPALADVEATISVVKTNSESIILKLVPCGDSEYYCFLNDSYSGFIVDRSVLYKDNGHNMSGFGVWDAYLLANEAIDNKNTNDVYNRP